MRRVSLERADLWVDRLQQVMDVPFFDAYSRRRRRFAKYFRFLVSFSRLEFVVALFSTTTTAASESQPQPAAAEKEFDSESGL